MLSRSRVRVRVNRWETCIWGTPTRSPIWGEFLHEPQVDDLPVPLIELVGQRGDGVEVLDRPSYTPRATRSTASTSSCLGTR
ncbi:hypothetical protein SCHAM137S_03638 [Streptomyces chartreusis]